MFEADLTKKDMKFKSVDLKSNPKHVRIPKKKFLIALVKNLNIRLNTVSYNLNSTEIDRSANKAEYEVLLENFSVLEKSYWPFDTSTDYGTKEIEYLFKRFDLDLTTNLSLFRSYLDCDGKIIPAGLVPLINLLKIIPISTSEDERGFSAMNLICTDLRSSLTVENMSALVFIKINGPPINLFDSEKYVQIWFR